MLCECTKISTRPFILFDLERDLLIMVKREYSHNNG